MTGSAKPIAFLKCRCGKAMGFTSFNPSYALLLRRRPRGRLEQVLPLPLQRFEPLTREPGCRGYGARVAFVADLAQGVADQAQRVGGVERFVERVFHVEAKGDGLRRGARGGR